MKCAVIIKPLLFMICGGILILGIQIGFSYFHHIQNKDLYESAQARESFGNALVEYIEKGRPRRSEIFYQICSGAHRIHLRMDVFIKEFGGPDDIKTLVATGKKCYVYYITANGDDEFCAMISVDNDIISDCGWSNKKWWDGAYK
jgi:hypothetical protein